MINLLYGGNFKVLDGIYLSLISINKNTNAALNVFILTADVTELKPDYNPIKLKDIAAIEEYLKQKNPESKIKLITLGKEFNNWILKSQNKLNQYTPFAFLRLFADTIESIPDKIIYLDTDIMVPGDIKTLFDFNIDNYELAAVKDHYGKIFINPKYFNSGVLLMNMKNIKETKLLEKVKNMCQTKKMSFPDQTALNKLATKVLYLPRKFNEQYNLHKNTIVHHFCKKIRWLPYFRTENIKQWQIEKVHKRYKIFIYDDIYSEFLKLKNLK